MMLPVPNGRQHLAMRFDISGNAKPKVWLKKWDGRLARLFCSTIDGRDARPTFLATPPHSYTSSPHPVLLNSVGPHIKSTGHAVGPSHL
jgi:hypothetical protein